MSLVSQMQDDTLLILADWADSLLVERNTINLTNAIPVDSWATVATYSGDWQPYRDRKKPESTEAGINDLYDSRVFLQYNADVEIGDRITKDSTYYEYVQKILKYEDHIELLTTRNKNSL